MENAEHTLCVCARWGAEREAVGRAVGAQLTPDTMVFLMLQSEQIWMLIESFVTLVMKRGSSMGVRSAAATRASRNRIGACTRGPASWVDLAVRVDLGRNVYVRFRIRQTYITFAKILQLLVSNIDHEIRKKLL